MNTTSEAGSRTRRTGTRRTLATVGAVALTLLGIPAGLILGTQGSAQAVPGGNAGGTVRYEVRTTPSVVAPGDPVTVHMIAVDKSTGADLSDVTSQTQFSISPQDAGSCVANVCTPTALGTLTIYGQYSAYLDSDTDSTTIASLAPDHLVVSPVYTTATAGQTIAYSVFRAAADGTILDDDTSRATVTLGGAACPGAVCTARTPGQQTLTATDGAMTAGGAVVVQAGPATTLVVSPHVDGLWSDAQPATFTVEAYDDGGNDLGDVTAQSTFAVSPNGICTANACTGGGGGSHTVTATYGSATGSVTLDASGPLPLVTPALPAGQVGKPYSQTVLTYAGDSTRTELDASSTLPPGLTLGPDGVLSGTPTRAGTYAFNVAAINDNGGVNRTTTITIAPGTVAAKPTVSVHSASVKEGATGRTPVRVTVSLNAVNSAPVTVSWHTINGTAVAGKDYDAAHGTVTIPAGRLTAQLTVSVIGDRVKEKNEAFVVLLTAPHNATLGMPLGAVIISNDD
jgi:hypothetical protein